MTKWENAKNTDTYLQEAELQEIYTHRIRLSLILIAISEQSLWSIV